MGQLELRFRARDVQERIGWAKPHDTAELTRATLELAQVVVELTERLVRLEASS